MRDPRIIAQKLGSEVCAAKSSDGPNPYFAHNIYIVCTVKMYVCGSPLQKVSCVKIIISIKINICKVPLFASCFLWQLNPEALESLASSDEPATVAAKLVAALVDQ